MKLSRRPPDHEVSPQSIQQGSVEGIPVPDAVRGLRVTIDKAITYDATIPSTVKKYIVESD